MGEKDELFDSRYSAESFERMKDYCKSIGTDWVDLTVFDGTHEFTNNDDAIYKLINDIAFFD